MLTTQPLSSAAQARQEIELRFLAGPRLGEVLPVNGAVLIGKDAANHLCLSDDDSVSRFHALLEANHHHCRVRDLSSSNGVWVNRVRVSGEVELDSGDTVRCGRTEFQVRFGRRPAEAELTVHVDDGTVEPAKKSVLAPIAPDQFPGYEVIRKLAQGGMGVIYHARDLEIGQEVAIKAIRPDLVSSQADQRFFREIAAMLQLRHPRIVQFIEVGNTAETIFLVMEYVETVNLADELASRSPKSQMRLSTGLMTQVLDALSYAHDLGWIHRDLKPANVLIQLDGEKRRAKVSDFGLAKNLERAGLSCVTSDGQVLGSYPYMAPEQAVGARGVNFAADIFSAGATLYYWLSREYPCEFVKGRSKREIAAECKVVPLEVRRPDLPPELCRVVNQSLAKDPRERFRSAGQMREELGNVRKAIFGEGT